jgi:Ni,Fe-hydrogenase I small subunit
MYSPTLSQELEQARADVEMWRERAWSRHHQLEKTKLDYVEARAAAEAKSAAEVLTVVEVAPTVTCSGCTVPECSCPGYQESVVAASTNSAHRGVYHLVLIMYHCTLRLHIEGLQMASLIHGPPIDARREQ